MIKLSYSYQLIRQILRDMRKHKLRSMLAMFGIIWGTVTVVLLLAIGQSFYQASKKNMLGFADGSMMFYGRTTSKPYHGIPTGTHIFLKANEVMNMRQQVAGIRWISPIFRNKAIINHNNHKETVKVVAVSPDFMRLTNLTDYMSSGGRFIDPLDVAHQSNVIFLGAELLQSLFGKNKPFGEQLEINGIPFTVVGGFTKTPGSGDYYNRMAIIPYTTAIKLWGDLPIESFQVIPYNINQGSQLKWTILNYLAYKLHFDPQDPSAMVVFEPSLLMEFFNWFFLSIQLFLGFCGVLTLIVGGIGVANVMFLIVVERTAEIGLRLALGAKRTHIMGQILLETGVIVFFGGGLGFLFSALIIAILQHAGLPSWLGVPQLSLSVAIITACILALLGLLAGYFPARRAAQMQPVKALAFGV